MNKPILHQLKTDGSPLDGMSYVIETGDGRLIVIDGGMKNDVEYLYSYLKGLCRGENPTVDLWIITHAHADHTFAFFYMIEGHSHEITVKQLMFRFPRRSFFEQVQRAVLKELDWMDELLPAMKGMEIVTPSAGERYSFGQLHMEILYTCADLPPLENAPIPQCTNDTSLVFRFTYEGQSILFLGDVQAAGNRVMIDRYGKDLKSDVMQLAHHGELSSTEEFYRMVDPDIVLWPVNKRHVDRLSCSSMSANYYIFRESNAKAFVIAGEGTRAMPLPLCAEELPGKDFLLKDRELVASIVIPEAKKEPQLACFDDEGWDGVPFLPVDVFRFGSDTESRCFYRALWTEDALYFGFRYEKERFEDDPQQISTLNCNLIRIYYTEEPVKEYTKRWRDLTDGVFFDNMKVFPNVKTVDGKSFTYTREDLCECSSRVKDGCWKANVRIPFSKKATKGKLVAFGFEICGVPAPGMGRNLAMWITPERDSFLLPCAPAATAVAILS